LKFDRDIAMSVFAGITTGLIPSVVMRRFDFEAARTNLVTTPDGDSYRVVPTVRLHFSYLDNVDFHSSYGTTSAGGFAIGADLCTPLHYDRAGFVASLCAEFMGGYFAVRTTTPLGVQGPTKITGFSTGGLGLDLAYNLTRHFHVGLKMGAALVIGAVTAEATDGAEIFRSSVLSLHGLLGAGGHF
jgi:hypothetical protein